MVGTVSGQVGKTDYRYDKHGLPERGNLTEIEYWNNNPVNPETPIIEKHYDQYGNMDWEEDALDNRTTYVYDSVVHTYPVTITNAAGHTMTYTWKYEFGKIWAEKDPNDKIISNSYDEFRRLTQTDYPDGGQSVVDYTYLDDENEFPQYIKASVKENAGSFIESWKYVDGLGRKIQNVTKGKDNQNVVSRTYYDQMGRAYRAEGPYFSSVRDYYSQNPPQNSFPWTETNFDLRGRRTLVESPTDEHGIVESDFEYSGFSTTIIDPDGCKLALASGTCRLRIFNQKRDVSKDIVLLRPVIVIVSDVPGNEMSGRSCAGHIATTVTKEFRINPQRMLWIEYYPPTEYGKKVVHTMPERYDSVEFTWKEGKAIEPKWRPLKPPILDEVKTLIKTKRP